VRPSCSPRQMPPAPMSSARSSRGGVAAYEYPRRVWLVGALPKTSTKKILKREITIPEELTYRPSV
jgi:acyl-coenzyme A synthetase/AMP-(fatty) acid ligase